MPEVITISAEDFERQAERLKHLARDKANIQLIMSLMTSLAAVQGLDNVLHQMLQIVLEHVGGTGLMIYYRLDSDLFCADVQGKSTKIERVVDPLVQRVFETRQFIEQQHDFSDTKMQTPKFSDASTWVFPLIVGPDVIGVCKIENMHILASELHAYLPTFFSYAALLLKNEIMDHTHLQKAYRQLEEEVVARKDAESELRAAKLVLEDKVTERTAELHRVNMLCTALGHLNNFIMEASSEADLVAAVCRIAVQHAGVQTAWIGWWNRNARHVTRVAAAGSHRHDIATRSVPIREGAHDPGFIEVAICEERPCVAHTIAASPSCAPSCSTPLDRVFHSAVAVPIRRAGRVDGVMCLYSARHDVFHAKELALLEEISAALTMGLERVRAESERKTAEQKAARLAAIVTSTDDAIIGKTLEGLITSWNHGAEVLYGYAEDEVIGKPVSILDPEGPAGEFQQILETIRKGSHVEHYETLRRRKDGTPVSVSLTVSPLLDQDGRVIGASAIGRDITGQKRLEQALRESESLYRTLAEHAKDLIVRCLPDGTLTYVSPSCQSLLGYAPDSLIGTSILDLIHPDDLERVRDAVGRLASSSSVTIECRCRTQSGSYVWVETSGAIVRDPESSAIVDVACAIRGISERKHAENLLRKSEEKYRTLFEESFDGLFITSTAGRLLDINRKGVSIFGYARKEEMLGLDMARDVYADPLDRAKILAMVNAQGVAEYDVDLKKKSGDRLSAHCSLTAACDDSGSIASYRGIIRDVTRQREVEKAVRQANDTLRATLEAAPVAILDLDSEGRVAGVWNAAAEQMLGWRRAEVLGQMLPSVPKVNGDARADVPEWLHSEVPIVGHDDVGQRKDGSTIEYSVYAAPKYGDRGRVIGKIAVLMDITERKQAEREHLAHLQFFENMDRIDQAIRNADDLERAVNDVFDILLTTFHCDRAWLVYPCDPNADHWSVTIERTRPEYPGAGSVPEIKMEPDVATLLRTLLEAGGPVRFGPAAEQPLAPGIAERFGYQSQLCMALYPEGDRPYVFGIHQCSHPREWTLEDVRLFREVGRRLVHVLTGILAFRDLRLSEERFRALFENSPVPIWEEDFSAVKTLFDQLRDQGVSDLENYFDEHPELLPQCAESVRVLDVNRAALTMHEAGSKEQLLGNATSTLTPGAYSTFRKGLISLWRGHSQFSDDALVQTLGGTSKPVTVYASLCSGYEDTFSRVLISFFDITERKRVEDIRQARIYLLEYADTHTVEELLTATLDRIEALTGSSIGFYHFLEDDQETLHLQNWSTNTLESMCTAEGHGTHYPISQAGVWVDCVYERRPIMHNDYNALPHRKGMPEGHAQVTREVVVPVFRGNLIKAIVGLGNKMSNYVESDVEIVSQLADLSWDIVERKRAEREIRRTAEEWQTTFDSIADMVSIQATDCTLIRVNKAYARTLDTSPDTLLGKKCFEVMHGALCPVPGCPHQQTIQTREPALVETWEPRLQAFLEVTTAPIYDSAGEIRGSIHIAKDITERKRAEVALRRSEEDKTIQNEIAKIFLTVPDEDIYSRVLAVIVRVIPSPFGLFGYISDSGDLIIPSLSGAVWNECQISDKSIVFPPSSWDDTLWGRAIREKRLFSSTGPFHTPAGHIPIQHFLTAPILFGQKAIGLISIADKEGGYDERDEQVLLNMATYISPILNARLQRDVHDRNRAAAEEEVRMLNAELERRVQKRTAELESANKELEAFSHSVSHDLRAPLRHLTGFVNLLTKHATSNLDEKSIHYLAVIAESATSMGKLIDDILSFSRLGRVGMLMTRVRMDDIVAEVLRMFHPDLEGRDVVLSVSRLPEVYGSPEMLATVMANLVSNAIKFSSQTERAVIEIGHMPHPTHEVFFVRDNGAGFDMKYSDKLFGLFQRLHRMDEFEGTGLGLANVRRIIRRHRGRTWAEGAVGKGATVYFSLPKDTGEEG